ncbi:MAG TPA: PhzF family phenazine biosynthesis protein [Myxococcota bacterium]|nr:PhzF family phenazine biosynthesis protein [Myxococcota bacterium]
MPRYDYRLVEVFTAERFGGNPLAVFPRAEELYPELMQRFAAELNLSEATFVMPSTRRDCDYRVRIFTPRSEIPMAGHPTIGTAFVLGHGDRVVFEEGVGPVLVERATSPSGAPIWRMTQPRPRFGPRLEDRPAVAAALGLDARELEAKLPIFAVATGLPFLMVPLRDLEALARARLELERWKSLGEQARDLLPFPFVQVAPTRFRCRMFAPQAGIAEDPATGSAAGPLGAYLVAQGVIPAGAPARLECEQGIEMGRPSRLYVEVDGTPSDIPAVRVGGECISMGGGYFEL